ncbi:MAG: sugar phosphate isomerase/epimerase [Dysgonamonadaceae bacterium]|jgi:sugar phosphate isomerase/epimerase|nr:sugar phosphate isomerase/epimerase [Dysgonamonadaceae bacterium]
MKTFKFIFLLSLCGLFIVPVNAQRNSRLNSPRQGKNIGIQMYSLRDYIGPKSENIDTVIKIIGKMGYKFVETANYNDRKFYGMTPETFKAKLQAAGLWALSSHTGMALPKDYKSANWDEIWAWWDKAIADHKAAGMKYIVTAWMAAPETIEELQAYCDYYNKIGEKCNAAGLKFGYHNHNHEFAKKYPDGAVMYNYMLEHTNPDLVFFEMDVYWTVMGQNSPVDLFKKYPGRFLALHIKDKRELGQSGMVGFDAIFNNISTAGTKYPIVEVEEYSMAPAESCKASLDYLNRSRFVAADYAK